MFSKIKTILKATRLHRTTTILVAILVSAAIKDKINFTLFLFAINYIIIYSSIGLHNAKKDKDYLLPKKINYLILLLIFFAIIISLQNKLLLFSTITIVSLGFVYNTISRKILFADTTILAITHNTFPIFMGLLILGEPIKTSIINSLFFFITLWPIINLKDLKDFKTDKKRNYKTIGTNYSNKKQLGKLVVILTTVLTLPALLIIKNSIPALLVFLTYLLINLKIYFLILKERYTNSLNFMRLTIILFFTSIIFSKTLNPIIILVNSIIILLYLIFLKESDKQISKKKD